MADLNIGNSSASVVVNAKHNGSVIPQINNTYDLGTSNLRWKNIYGSLKGNADSATKLTTARTIRTNLASTSAASFDGSANITPGVTGTLPIANGGTGATTAITARDNLGAQSKVLYGDSEPSDTIGTNGDLYVALYNDRIKQDIVDLIYPVGSIYISMNSTNPSTLFGGTWEAFGQGRTLIGAGTGNDGSTSMSFKSNQTGGEYSHILTINEMPKHNHKIQSTSGKSSTSKLYPFQMIQQNGNYMDANVCYSEGRSLAHNNIQPYLVVYFWRRTN